jgi:hypothetical protein
MSVPHDTPEGLLADLAQVLLTLLFVYLDAREICLPRSWVARWHQDLTAVLEQLRHTA